MWMYPMVPQANEWHAVAKNGEHRMTGSAVPGCCSRLDIAATAPAGNSRSCEVEASCQNSGRSPLHRYSSIREMSGTGCVFPQKYQKKDPPYRRNDSKSLCTLGLASKRPGTSWMCGSSAVTMSTLPANKLLQTISKACIKTGACVNPHASADPASTQSLELQHMLETGCSKDTQAA